MKELLESTDELESPKNYFYWSALTAISAVCGKKIWVNRGGVYNLYPGIYTFLISKKSGLRKGIPISVAKKLVYEVGKVRIIDGQNSIQGVLKELAKVKTVGDGHVIKDAQGFLITGEFASFLLQDGSGLSLTLLTDLYDAQYHEQGFTKRLASQEEITLKNPCLTALFASNETHFFDSIPKHAITGGFLARTFCIYEERRNTINPLTRPVKKQINYEDIIKHLIRISKLEGVFRIDHRAIEVYEEWYYDFCGKGHDQEDETGTSERLGDNIWKAAMLISLASGSYELIEDDKKTLSDMLITEDNMIEAIIKSVDTFSGIKKLLLGGSNDTKNVKSIVMRTTVACILETEPIFEQERKMILRKGIGMFGVYDLDECIEYLVQAGMIKIEKRGQGIYYKLTEMMIKKHLQIKEKEKQTGDNNAK